MGGLSEWNATQHWLNIALGLFLMVLYFIKAKSARLIEQCEFIFENSLCSKYVAMMDKVQKYRKHQEIQLI